MCEVYASLKISQVQSEEQAAAVCDVLGVDALVVPTVTLYDPYDPPKFGAALQVFEKPAGYVLPEAGESTQPSIPVGKGFRQAVGIFDAANEQRKAQRVCSFMPRAATIRPGRWPGKSIWSTWTDIAGLCYNSLIRDLLYRMDGR